MSDRIDSDTRPEAGTVAECRAKNDPLWEDTLLQLKRLRGKNVPPETYLNLLGRAQECLSLALAAHVEASVGEVEAAPAQGA